MDDGIETPRNSATRTSLEEVRREYLDSVNKLLNDQPEKFRTLICHGVLGRPLSNTTDDQGLRNPFSPEENNDVSSRAADRYAYIADLLLRDQNGGRGLPSSEFISIAQFVEADVNLDRWLGRVTFRSPRATDMWHEYFSEFEDQLSYSVSLATLLIHQGVPPYQINAAKSGYERISSRDPLYQYLRIRGEAFDVVRDLNIPAWAKRLFFRQEDLRWHRILFASYDSPDLAKEKELRAALLKHLGLSSVEEQLETESRDIAKIWPWGTHETVLLRHLAAAANRFWVNYDPSDIGTAPTNSVVIDWLRERGVAQRTAEVIATLLRADGLPTGPRP